ncbi:MAG: SMI1/KNR4 family protein, partial [Mucilaginibacter sp.]
IKLPLPVDTISYYINIKKLSNQYWETTGINYDVFGFQVQQGTKWKDGLSQSQINDFEKEMGFTFPESLKNFYSVMNGLNKPGINVFGSQKSHPSYSPLFYSYPEDLDLIKTMIKSAYKENDITAGQLMTGGTPKIFPVLSHRFLVLNGNGSPVISINGNDSVYWADSLSKLLGVEILDNIYNAWDFESRLNTARKIDFWLDEKQ